MMNRRIGSLVARARELRRRATPEERTLWECLRNRQLGGWKFRRQEPFGNFIVDFACIEARLIIELDGSQHYETEHTLRDQERDRALNDAGYNVLRFPNNEITTNLDQVLQQILNTCNAHNE